MVKSARIGKPFSCSCPRLIQNKRGTVILLERVQNHENIPNLLLGYGTVVHKGKGVFDVGHIMLRFDLTDMTDFDGEIILQNEKQNSNVRPVRTKGTRRKTSKKTVTT